MEPEELRLNATPRPEHALKRCPTPEDLPRSQLPFITDGQLVTPPGSPARKDFSPIFRRHARAEAVRVLSFALVWLKRPLHDNSSGNPTG
jgi:hypothetical protein